jgi:hypothetical protein
MTRSWWVIPTIASVAAAALFVAGVIEWRMFSTLPACPADAFCGAPPPVYRLHPLRAELLWAASAVFGLLAGSTRWRARRRPSVAQPAAG